MLYVCQELNTDNVCIQWVEQSPTMLDELAISREDAGTLTIALCSLIVLAYIGGLIGRTMLDK